ncbi:MAG: efflux RND transporter periplasmic adaptor subunit [Gemmatimonadales bacterium]|nr:efflux RND transporter periplasmic adaptor subunit [Gemmatimonadales bacterium]
MIQIHRWAWGLAVVALLAGCKEERRAGSSAVPVTVAKAERRTVPFEVSAPGTVEPIRAVAVTAQVSGLVTGVRFREGDLVEAGQVLVEIDPRPYRNALQQAEASLARDLIQLDNARRQVERYQGLAQSEYITSEQYETLKTNAAALAATVQADSAAVANARLNLDNTTIRAPISGRTGSLLIKEGNLVRAQGGEPLVLVNQIRPILIRFAVPASFLPAIRARRGEALAVRAVPGQDSTELVGRLLFVDNAVDTTTGTILLKGQFANADGMLWPGQFATATLVLYQENDAILVPTPAIVAGEAGSYVFIVTPEKKAVVRAITVGRTVGEFQIVTSGLEAGETVVTDGQLRLTEGSVVDVKNVDAGR